MFVNTYLLKYLYDRYSYKEGPGGNQDPEPGE